MLSWTSETIYSLTLVDGVVEVLTVVVVLVVVVVVVVEVVVVVVVVVVVAVLAVVEAEVDDIVEWTTGLLTASPMTWVMTSW